MTRRIAVIDKERCNPKGCGDFLCIRVCPINRTGSECITKGEDNKPVIDEGLCTGCGICPNRCPYDAISIVNLPEELNHDPLHRYGRNGFHLYNLPVPQYGKVVGILGRNGIGKSTAVKILSGMLKPNLGREEEAGWDELIEYFKGSEAQNFFESLKKGEVSVNYKPQQVELIPKSTKGKVKDVLENINEKDNFEEIIEKLDLKDVLDNDINNLSGGELQRVAIAATVLKKSNLYIFDEPTSFLDMKQRIKISKFIRELADENTAVLVVEHDLIVLDYMSDQIHIMYGKERTYGVVSNPVNTRTGINMFLYGYIKDENVRIRDSKIKFEKRQSIKSEEREQLASWEGIKKKLGKFELRADKGDIHKKDVIGVLGENGIGKTSFVKILADVVKPDEGSIEGDVRVSYKPQYLDSSSEELVMSVLGEAVEKYKNQLIHPLSLEPLLNKQINQLSGGELQRVAIAECLSKKADLYLMDEPSAYIDVEQRLSISKIIKDFIDVKGKTCVIVDHDLLFIDYISDKVITFEGKPAIEGDVKGPYGMEEGMNYFLQDLDMSFRRDEESNRPRANKENSQMDQKQKKQNRLYYI